MVGGDRGDVAAPLLAHTAAQVVHQQPVLRGGGVAPQQGAEGLQAELVAMAALGAQAMAGQQALQLLQGHALPGHQFGGDHRFRKLGGS